MAAHRSVAVNFVCLGENRSASGSRAHVLGRMLKGWSKNEDRLCNGWGLTLWARSCTVRRRLSTSSRISSSFFIRSCGPNAHARGQQKGTSSIPFHPVAAVAGQAGPAVKHPKSHWIQEGLLWCHWQRAHYRGVMQPRRI